MDPIKPTTMKVRKSMMPAIGKKIMEKKTVAPAKATTTKTAVPMKPKAVKFSDSSAPPALGKASMKRSTAKFGYKKLDHLEEAKLSMSGSRKTSKMSPHSPFSSRATLANMRMPQRTICPLQQQFVDQLKMDKKELISGGEDTIEIGLVLDITSSMSCWIERAKETIIEIIDKVVSDSEEDGKVVPKISFVGYRDHGDSTRFAVKPFTSNVSEIKEFIHSMTALGGKDIPEDVVGGLKLSLMQDWS